MNTLLAVLVFIGTRQDLRAHRAILEELNVPIKRVRLIADPRARDRFATRTGAFYRARWGRRSFHLVRGLPDIVVVFGRASVSGRWQSGCIGGQTVTCEAEDVKGCVEVIRDTWCKEEARE